MIPIGRGAGAAELRRLAEAAREYEPPWELVAAPLPPAARKYLLAFEPTVVLGLLDRIEALEGALRRLTDALEEEYGPRFQAVVDSRALLESRP